MSCRTSKIPLSLCVFLVLALAAAAGCGKASPTAPTGSTLTLAVNPVTIVSSVGSATATATLRRANGTPDPGARIQFNTTLGSFNPSAATTDGNGVASSTLTGDGRIGTAKVTAFSGAVMATEVDVTVGSPAALITLQATPSTIGQGGGNIDLVALVRDAQGNPVPGSPVSFTAQAGTLKSRGQFVSSDSSGAARDVLTVTAADLTNQTGNSFNVGVQGSTGSAVTFAVNIARAPVASFTATVTQGNLTVSFTDTSTNHPTSWLWTFNNPASGANNTSTEQNPAHTFTRPGSYVVTLTATNAIGSGSTSQGITVTGPPGQ
jgi:hypothetical protein